MTTGPTEVPRRVTRQDLATLSCKILALWLFAQAALAAWNVLLFAILLIVIAFGNHERFQWDQCLVVGSEGIPGIGCLIVGVVLWRKASAIARRMVPDDSDGAVGLDVASDNVMAVAFSAVGVFTLMPIVRQLSSTLIQFLEMERFTFRQQYWDKLSWQAQFWAMFIELGFAIWLIFGSRGIVRLVVWAKTAVKGRSEESTNN